MGLVNVLPNSGGSLQWASHKGGWKYRQAETSLLLMITLSAQDYTNIVQYNTLFSHRLIVCITYMYIYIDPKLNKPFSYNPMMVLPWTHESIGSASGLIILFISENDVYVLLLSDSA